MPKFVLPEDDTEKPMTVNVEKDDDSPDDMLLRLNGWAVAALRGDTLELIEAAGCEDELDKILDKDGFIKVRREGTTKLLK